MSKKYGTAKKTIIIACEGADLVDIDDFEPFQGDLKFLSDDAYERMKKSLLELNFSYPIEAFKWKGKKYIMDAHQRILTMKRMRDEEGYHIPKLPTSWVHAKSLKEAAKKVLASASEYGVVTPDGLYNFIKAYDLDEDEILESFKLPEIDMPKFMSTYFADEVDVSFKAKIGSKEIDGSEFDNLAHKCPKCGFTFND